MCSSEFNLQGTNMNYLPSKELLSEVLGHKIWKVMDCNMGTLRYCIYPNKGDEPSEYIFPINIYELAHKCKEWLEIQCPSYDIMITENQVYIMNDIWGEGGASIAYSFSLEKEWYLNLFLACQWILDIRN